MAQSGLPVRSGIARHVFLFCRFFNFHVAKFFGIEDFAALEALDKFGVFVP